MTAEPNKDLLRELQINRAASSGSGRRWLWILVLLPLALVTAGGWWVYANRELVVAVEAATAREEGGASASAVLNASGYVTARRRATVSSKITGKVVEVLVEEGMRIGDGQVLARLDDTIARANLAVAEAELDAARRALAETEVRLKEARLRLERTRRLVSEGVSSQAELDAVEAEAGSLDARLELGREQVAVADRNVALRRQELDDTVIRAPFAGVAVSKDAQPGEMVSPISAGGGFTRTGICTIVDMGSLEIEVDVNENYIARVRDGQPVEAVLDAYPDWRIPAHVITTIPTADRQKATVRVRIAFEKLDPRILPDMGVKVTFLGEPLADGAKPRVLIPRAAVRQENGQAVVYVVQQDRVERRAVTLGAEKGNDVEVRAGVRGGERIVTRAQGELTDGARVKVS